jgi:RNAse (barnase) inhibitor barstar
LAPEEEPTKVIVIDGALFDDLDGFYDEVSRRIIPGASWGRNLNAFNDILRGGFGTPEQTWILRWENAALSRERLGHDAMARQLRRLLSSCHPDNRQWLAADLHRAENREGQTLFDTLIEIIRSHGPDGTEAGAHVYLELLDASG